MWTWTTWASANTCSGKTCATMKTYFIRLQLNLWCAQGCYSKGCWCPVCTRVSTELPLCKTSSSALMCWQAAVFFSCRYFCQINVLSRGLHSVSCEIFVQSMAIVTPLSWKKKKKKRQELAPYAKATYPVYMCLGASLFVVISLSPSSLSPLITCIKHTSTINKTKMKSKAKLSAMTKCWQLTFQDVPQAAYHTDISTECVISCSHIILWPDVLIRRWRGCWWSQRSEGCQN